MTKFAELNEPMFNFKDPLYSPFDLTTTEIRYIINKVKNGTASISLECSGFCIGRIQIPEEFISKLKYCKICPSEFVFASTLTPQ
jgi:hypothetical protein